MPRLLPLAALLLGLAVPGPLVQAADPIRVTTDTAEYCLQLGTLLEQRRHGLPAELEPAPRIALLSIEGRRMCDDGKFRAGIARLRRALLMLRDGTAD